MILGTFPDFLVPFETAVNICSELTAFAMANFVSENLSLNVRGVRKKEGDLSGPNRAMQPRCAMRFESHIPKSPARRKSFLFCDAKTHSLDLKSLENARK